MNLCNIDSCRKPTGHSGSHDPYPSSAWDFMRDDDKDKLTKAGFATPRGGDKGAYQNHVSRSNRVIIPFEKMNEVPLDQYDNEYVIRIFPDQYFDAPGEVKPIFNETGAPQVGVDAFLLYRTHDQLTTFPPLEGWRVRTLTLNGAPVTKRVRGAVDSGEYVLRIPRLGQLQALKEGPPQGIFAPEYADAKVNYLAKCLLAWLIVHTVDSPYVAIQAEHLQAILWEEGLLHPLDWEALGLMRGGFTSCPLCMKLISHNELHDQVSFDDEDGLLNAPDQVPDATRSTVVNLFHMVPLTYSDIEHKPQNVAWGHAICNTKLGQRKCYPWPEVLAAGSKVGTVDEHGVVSTFGWITQNLEMIRSPRGAVWIRIVEDHLSGEEQARLLEFLAAHRGE